MNLKGLSEAESSFVVLLSELDHSRFCARYQRGLVRTKTEDCNCYLMELSRLFHSVWKTLADLLKEVEAERTPAAEVLERARVLTK